jgi:hypothetical protein
MRILAARAMATARGYRGASYPDVAARFEELAAALLSVTAALVWAFDFAEREMAELRKCHSKEFIAGDEAALAQAKNILHAAKNILLAPHDDART